jgi:hypothetical protein
VARARCTLTGAIEVEALTTQASRGTSLMRATGRPSHSEPGGARSSIRPLSGRWRARHSLCGLRPTTQRAIGSAGSRKRAAASLRAAPRALHAGQQGVDGAQQVRHRHHVTH